MFKGYISITFNRKVKNCKLITITFLENNFEAYRLFQQLVMLNLLSIVR